MSGGDNQKGDERRAFLRRLAPFPFRFSPPHPRFPYPLSPSYAPVTFRVLLRRRRAPYDGEQLFKQAGFKVHNHLLERVLYWERYCAEGTNSAVYYRKRGVFGCRRRRELAVGTADPEGIGTPHCGAGSACFHLLSVLISKVHDH